MHRYIYLGKLFLVALLVYFNPILVHSQDNERSFEMLSIYQGLSQVTVRSITQDSRGFMWIANDDGLSRYDGNKFTIFKNDPTDSASISSNLVKCLFEDKRNNLWIGTRDGLNRFDRNFESFVRYKFKYRAEDYSDDVINAICEDSEGNLWIGTLNGVKHLDTRSGKFTIYKNDSLETQSLSHNVINALGCDKNGNIWIGTENGLNVWDVRTKKIKRFIDASIPSNSIQDLAISPDNLVWVSTGVGVSCFDILQQKYINNQFGWLKDLSNFTSFAVAVNNSGKVWLGEGGLTVYDPRTKTVESYKNIDKITLGFQGNSILDIYEDRSGIIWVGTNATGLIKIIPQQRKFATFHHDPVKNSISENTVWDVFEDAQGWIWVSTNKGFNVYNPTKGKWSTYFVNKDINKNIITAVLEDSKGNIWVCTNGEGLVKFDKKKQTISKIYKQTLTSSGVGYNYFWKIAEDKEGFLWLGTIEGGLIKFDPQTEKFVLYEHNPDNPNSLSSNTIYPILIDKEGIIWLGTDAAGLDRFDSKNGKITHFKNDPKIAGSLSNNTVISLCEDKEGNIWVGTNGGGLNKFDKSNSLFKVYREKDGLCNDAIHGIIEDEKGYLWLSTNKGLSKFDPKTEIFKNFDVKDGLQSNEFNAGAYFRHKSGRVYFGGINGFNLFYPDSIKDNPNVPSVVITDLSIFNKKVGIGNGSLLKKAIGQTDTLILSYKETFISFEFAAVSFINTEKNQFAYKLEGFDKDWYYIGNNRNATYTNLQPGNYTFRVKASNHHGVWNEQGTSLYIIIQPPFWQTIWFRILAIIIIIGTAVVLYKIRINIIKAQKRELEREVIARTLDLTQANEKIQELYREVKDSIRSAETIQKSILPSENFIKNHLPESFIFNKPKDIVSGDFYWFDAIQGKIILACVDSTGHGVSGAFMSMLGYSLLNQIIYSTDNHVAGEILEKLHQGLIGELHGKNEQSDIDDGMDIALCIIDVREKKLQFSGANSPLYLLRDKEIIQMKGNRYPIGITLVNDVKFSSHDIDLKEEDVIYLFSDGYADQFGGNSGIEKFQYNRFRELLKEIGNESITVQLELLNKSFTEWKGENEQMDDVLVIGFKPLKLAVEKHSGSDSKNEKACY